MDAYFQWLRDKRRTTGPPPEGWPALYDGWPGREGGGARGPGLGPPRWTEELGFIAPFSVSPLTHAPASVGSRLGAGPPAPGVFSCCFSIL